MVRRDPVLAISRRFGNLSAQRTIALQSPSDGLGSRSQPSGGMTVTMKAYVLATWRQNSCATAISVWLARGVKYFAVEARQAASSFRQTVVRPRSARRSGVTQRFLERSKSKKLCARSGL